MAGAEDYQQPYEDDGSLGDMLRGAVRFGRLLVRRHQTILWAVAACLAAAVVYYTLAPRHYRSTAKLQIIDQSGDTVSTVGGDISTDSVMTTQRELVRSSAVVTDAIERLAPEHRVDIADEPPNRWVEELTGGLSASTVRKTNLVEVSYRSQDPETAAAVVNAVINSYVSHVERTHRSTAKDILDLFTTQLSERQRELQEKQQLLRACRERCGHLAIDTKENVVDPVISRAIHLNDSLMEAQHRRLNLQASLASIKTAIQRGEDVRPYLSIVEQAVGEQMLLAALGLSQQDMEVLAKQQQRLMETQDELRRLAPHYGPNHPHVVALTEQANALQQYLSNYHRASGDRFHSMGNDELAPTIVRMLEQSIAQADEQERVLSASFDQARRDAARQSGDLVELEMRKREVERLESLHDVLFEKIAAVDLHQVQAPIRAVIVQEPLPDDEPISPRFGFVFLGATFLGCVIGAGLVYVEDLLDDRFGSPDEMASQLGVPVLSIVRQMSPLEGDGLEAVQMHRSPDAVESEAFRTLRTSLALSGDACERLIVSSAEPSDGKTTITSNLAVAFAQVGKRTLIIDADLRKPGMTALLDLKGKTGVTDILVNPANPKQIADLAEQSRVNAGIDCLDVIPAGPRRADAAELLSGRNFAQLLSWAEANYDQVLIDCPPVLAVSDAQVVGRLADGVILVVSPEKNHRRLVSRACDSFLAARVHVFGVVANRITESDGSYSYGYGYGYRYGHGLDEEESTAAMADLSPNALSAPQRHRAA